MLATRNSQLASRCLLADSRHVVTRTAFSGLSALFVATLLVAMASAFYPSTANAAPLVVGVVPAPGQDIHDIIEGVKTDLFDVAQGAVVTSSSPLFTTFDARSAIGYINPSGIEQSRTIFSSSLTTTDFIDFQTNQPIDLGHYRLFLGQDGDGSNNRSATAFRLYASSNSGDVQSHLVSLANISATYTATYGSPAISVSESLNLPSVQYFRLEIDRAFGFSGPRVIELDGFAAANPLTTLVNFDFTAPVPSGVNDVNGLGTGFTHWLPGTGGAIPRNDPNLNLLTIPGYLAFTSQRSDINQFNGYGRNLPNLDSPGTQLTNMVGRDFRIVAKFDDVDVPGLSDQLLLYVGTDADNVLRGGFHENGTHDPSGNTGQFVLAGNSGSGDFGFPEIGLFETFTTGDDIVLSLSRIDGIWSLSWENLTNPAGNGSFSGIDMPSLDAASDLYVGIMHLDARNFSSQTAKLDYFRVEVGAPVPEPSSVALGAFAGLMLLVGGGRRHAFPQLI